MAKNPVYGVPQFGPEAEKLFSRAPYLDGSRKTYWGKGQPAPQHSLVMTDTSFVTTDYYVDAGMSTLVDLTAVSFPARWSQGTATYFPPTDWPAAGAPLRLPKVARVYHPEWYLLDFQLTSLSGGCLTNWLLFHQSSEGWRTALAGLPATVSGVPVDRPARRTGVIHAPGSAHPTADFLGTDTLHVVIALAQTDNYVRWFGSSGTTYHPGNPTSAYSHGRARNRFPFDESRRHKVVLYLDDTGADASIPATEPFVSELEPCLTPAEEAARAAAWLVRRAGKIAGYQLALDRAARFWQDAIAGTTPFNSLPLGTVGWEYGGTISTGDVGTIQNKIASHFGS